MQFPGPDGGVAEVHQWELDRAHSYQKRHYRRSSSAASHAAKTSGAS